jgi:ornithine cyclodeaminase/alanine dehydrogenase-like protein (mu-crystallin family)
VQKLFSLKNVTLFHDNPARGLPLVQATVLLSDAATGAPLAVLEGSSLTAIRTGGASGLATELLARADGAIVGVIGAGVQACTQLEAVCCARPIRRARVFSRHLEAARRFAAEMGRQLVVPVELAGSATAALSGSDIVCTATSSATPVFDDRDLAPGTHINAIGAYLPDMTEIPAATVSRARVVVDHRAAALEEAGDLLRPYRDGLIAEAHFGIELGDVILGRAPGRTRPEEITLFKSVGVAIQDLCARAMALENARRLGIRTVLNDAAE